jgi:rare lipoprotein A
MHGKASFYAKRATGSFTANGERLHHDSMTCAHRSLPFGTMIKVTHMGNDSSVVVRVNDRGPYVPGRIIDLSWGAARKLGMLGEGIAKVFLEPAGTIVIPLKPGKIHYEIPRVDYGLAVDTLGPFWQHELEIVSPVTKHKGKKKTTVKITK